MTKKHLMPMLCLGLILTLITVNINAQKDIVDFRSNSHVTNENSELDSENRKHNQSGLTLFPNPALNSVTINSENEINMIAITDINGTPLYSLSLPGIKEIDITNLQGGMYCIMAETDEGILQSKFIKL